MIRANGGICILLHMSLPNGRPHAAEMMTITEDGAAANCGADELTQTHAASATPPSCGDGNKRGVEGVTEERRRRGRKKAPSRFTHSPAHPAPPLCFTCSPLGAGCPGSCPGKGLAEQSPETKIFQGHTSNHAMNISQNAF